MKLSGRLTRGVGGVEKLRNRRYQLRRREWFLQKDAVGDALRRPLARACTGHVDDREEASRNSMPRLPLLAVVGLKTNLRISEPVACERPLCATSGPLKLRSISPLNDAERRDEV